MISIFTLTTEESSSRDNMLLFFQQPIQMHLFPMSSFTSRSIFTFVIYLTLLFFAIKRESQV